MPKHGGKKAEAEEGKEAEVEWGLRDLLGMVTRADLEGLPDGPVLRTEHRVLAVLLRKVRVLRDAKLSPCLLIRAFRPTTAGAVGLVALARAGMGGETSRAEGFGEERLWEEDRSGRKK